jgi:hypothetical protein
MQPRDLDPDAEFWGDRRGADAGGGARRPSYRRPLLLRVLRLPDRLTLGARRRPSAPTRGARARPPAAGNPSHGRARPLAAAILLAVLTTGWLVAGHRSRAAGSSAPAAARSSAPATPSMPASLVGRCDDRSAQPEGAHCVLDGVHVDVRAYAPGTAAAAYRRVAGIAATPHTGPPACEHGAPDERAWSEPAAPAVAVGRYRCSFENGRAVMWWTRGDRLAHAVAPDADLEALFAWWRAHPAE